MGLPGPPTVADPSRNYALVVAVEAYRARRLNLSLNGPALDAEKWVNWLIREVHVPAGNVCILASPMREPHQGIDNAALLAGLEAACRITRMGNDAVLDALLRLFQDQAGGPPLDRVVGPRDRAPARAFRLLAAQLLRGPPQRSGRRAPPELLAAGRPGLPPATGSDLRHLRHRFDDYENRQSLAIANFGEGSVDKACRQFLVFASEAGTVAINRPGAGGVFTGVLLDVLRSPAPNEPPDLKEACESGTQAQGSAAGRPARPATDHLHLAGPRQRRHGERRPDFRDRGHTTTLHHF